MELMNGEVFGAVNSLNDLFEREWPVDVSLKLAQLITDLSKQYETIDKVRVGIVKKYGMYDGERNADNKEKFAPTKTGNISIKPGDEKWDLYQEDFAKLMMQKTEVVFSAVTIPTKIDDKPIMISPKTLIALNKFIKAEG